MRNAPYLELYSKVYFITSIFIWDVMPCSLAQVYGGFGGTYGCLGLKTKPRKQAASAQQSETGPFQGVLWPALGNLRLSAPWLKSLE
jgi:hypothetical protein